MGRRVCQERWLPRLTRAPQGAARHGVEVRLRFPHARSYAHELRVCREEQHDDQVLYEVLRCFRALTMTAVRRPPLSRYINAHYSTCRSANAHSPRTRPHPSCPSRPCSSPRSVLATFPADRSSSNSFTRSSRSALPTATRSRRQHGPTRTSRSSRHRCRPSRLPAPALAPSLKGLAAAASVAIRDVPNRATTRWTRSSERRS